MNGHARPAGALSDAALDRLIAASSRNARALARLSRELLTRGDRARSIRLARQAMDLAPDDGNVRDLARRTLSTGVPSWHFELVRDDVRNTAYADALRRACRPGVRVLDIGSGTGLLAMMAARAGASEVITCEMNPTVADAAADIVAHNGFTDAIRVVAKKSTDLDLEADVHGPVDVIVSEIVSNNLLGEAALPAMQDAVSRLLKPGGRVIPSHGDVHVALAHYTRADRQRMTSIDGFDVSAFNRLAPACYRIPIGDQHLLLRSAAAVLFSFDFQSGGPYRERESSVVLATTGGPVNGIVQWIRLQLDGEGVYENRPSPGAMSAWAAMFHPFDRDVEPAPGAAMRINGAHSLTTVRLWAGPITPAE